MKSSIIYKPQYSTGTSGKIKLSKMSIPRSDTLFHCKVKPNNLFVLDECKECIWNTFLYTLYRLRLLNKHSLVPRCATFLYCFYQVIQHFWLLCQYIPICSPYILLSNRLEHFKYLFNLCFRAITINIF